MQNHNTDANDKVTHLQGLPGDNQQIVAAIIDVYENLNAQSIDRLGELYSDDIYFEDPAHAIQGISGLKSYFRKLFSNVTHCEFRFHSNLADSDKVFLSWTMTLQHSRLRRGEKIFVEGASLLKTRDGRIYYHRDYFDLGNMLYEHIPLVGGLVRQIKKGLIS